MSQDTQCLICNGEGEIPSLFQTLEVCPNCKGSGVIAGKGRRKKKNTIVTISDNDKCIVSYNYHGNNITGFAINESCARRAIRHLYSPAFTEIAISKIISGGKTIQLDISEELNGMPTLLCYRCNNSLRSPGHPYNERDVQWDCINV